MSKPKKKAKKFGKTLPGKLGISPKRVASDLSRRNTVFQKGNSGSSR